MGIWSGYFSSSWLWVYIIDGSFSVDFSPFMKKNVFTASEIVNMLQSWVHVSFKIALSFVNSSSECHGY